MTNAELSEKLKTTVLFREYTDDEIKAFLNLIEPQTAAAGEVIVRQDDAGDCMYVVVSGQCRVVHHKAGHNIDLAILKDGDFFGEISLVDDGPRSADVIAITDTSLLKVSQSVIFAMAGVYPSAGFKLILAIGRIMVERLRQANRRYVDSLLFPIQGKD